MPKSLQQLKDELSAIGRAVCEEGMSSASDQEADELFPATIYLLQAKRIIEKVINERASRTTEKEARRYRNVHNELLYGIPNPDNTGDSATLPPGGGVDGRDSGSSTVPGAAQTHEPEPQE